MPQVLCLGVLNIWPLSLGFGSLLRTGMMMLTTWEHQLALFRANSVTLCSSNETTHQLSLYFSTVIMHVQLLSLLSWMSWFLPEWDTDPDTTPYEKNLEIMQSISKYLFYVQALARYRYGKRIYKTLFLPPRRF